MVIYIMHKGALPMIYTSLLENIITVCLWAVSICIGIFLFKQALSFFTFYIEYLGKCIIVQILSRLKNRHLYLVLEMIYLVGIVVLFLYLLTFPDGSLIVTCVMFLYVSLGNSIALEYRRIYPERLTLAHFLEKPDFHRVYVFSRLFLLIRELITFFTPMTFITIFLIMLTYFEWPLWVYFFQYLVFPIILNVWVYFLYLKKSKGTTERANIRRTISYLLALSFSIIEGYSRFCSLHGIPFPISYDNFTFFSISSLIFIALDRLLKAVTEDYEKFQAKLHKEDICGDKANKEDE